MSILIHISIFIQHIRVRLYIAGISLSIQQMINVSISIGNSICRSINTHIYIYIHIRIFIFV